MALDREKVILIKFEFSQNSYYFLFLFKQDVQVPVEERSQISRRTGKALTMDLIDKRLHVFFNQQRFMYSLDEALSLRMSQFGRMPSNSKTVGAKRLSLDESWSSH